MIIATVGGAFLVGLVGSVHCLGMCGGISGALGMAGAGTRHRWIAPVLNSAGRVTSYAIAGALVGAVGWTLAEGGLPGVAHGLMLFTAVLFVLMGLSMLFRIQGLGALERAGARLWRRLQPLAVRALRMRGPFGAYAAGLLWGWLPCGLVYTVLAAAAASGHPAHGALLMTAFGAGTATAVIGAGIVASPGSAWLKTRLWLRRPVGALLIAIGLMTAAAPHLSDHAHHGSDHAKVLIELDN